MFTSRPLAAGHAPAETRAVSWTAAPALPISAARRAAPTALGSARLREARPPSARRDAAASPAGAAPRHPGGVRMTNGAPGDGVTLSSSQKTNDRMAALPLKRLENESKWHWREKFNATENFGRRSSHLEVLAGRYTPLFKITAMREETNIYGDPALGRAH